MRLQDRNFLSLISSLSQERDFTNYLLAQYSLGRKTGVDLPTPSAESTNCENKLVLIDAKHPGGRGRDKDLKTIKERNLRGHPPTTLSLAPPAIGLHRIYPILIHALIMLGLRMLKTNIRCSVQLGRTPQGLNSQGPPNQAPGIP
jgi:hypothetical protein